MNFKILEFTGIDQLINEGNIKKLRNSWNNSLAHQVPGDVLPKFDVVKSELTELFNTIFE